MKPAEGGSYVRNKDGSLTKVAASEKTKPAVPAKSEATADEQSAAPVNKEE